jgi:hypothetical protein
MKSKVVERILTNTPDWIKDKVDGYAKLLLSDVSGSLPSCKHEFEVKDQYWSSCKHCGMIIPNGNDR